MSQPSKDGCHISILDKDYLVNCPDDERDALLQAAEFLNRKMAEMREGGKVIGTERIAVMAALNMSHELLQLRREIRDYNDKVGAGVRRMQDKIELVLHKAVG